VHGLSLGNLPKGFAGLLINQVAVHDLTAEAVLKKSRSAALQALLVDPTISQYHGMAQMLDTIIEYQSAWLSYLR
jgi:alpha-galactosidase